MAAFVSNVVVRDDETGFGQIVHSTRVSRFDYLFGRFTGAFAAGCAAFISVPLGLLLGSVMPWLDPETLGPFRPGDYLYAYFAVALPTLVVMAAFCFALATITRSMFGTYIGLVAMLMTYFVSVAFLSRPEFERIVALIDPFGAGAYGYATKYWTAAERNTRLPEIAGLILWNRVIWLSVGFVFLTAAWLLYRPERKGVERGSGSGQSNRRRSAHPLRYQPPAGEAATRCRDRPSPAPGAGAVRHEGGLPKPGVLRPARHRLHQFDWRPVVRQPGSVRQRVLPGDAPDDPDAQRRVHDDPVDRGDLLRRRARMARARTADPGTGRCDTGPGLDVRASEGPGDHAGPAGHGCRRNRWPRSSCRFSGDTRASSSATISSGTSCRGRSTSRSSPSSPCSFKCSCRTSSSAGW